MPGHGLGGRRLREAGLEVLLPQLGIRPSAERHRRLRAGAAQARRADGEGGGRRLGRREQIHRQGSPATTRLMPAFAAAPARICVFITWQGRKPMRTKRWLWSGLALAAGLLPAIASAGEIKNYSALDPQRLTHPEPGNWLLYRRT